MCRFYNCDLWKKSYQGGQQVVGMIQVYLKNYHQLSWTNATNKELLSIWVREKYMLMPLERVKVTIIPLKKKCKVTNYR